MSDPLELVSGYLDHDLGDAELAELEAWILADPKHAAIFARRATVHSHIRDALAGEVSLRLSQLRSPELFEPIEGSGDVEADADMPRSLSDAIITKALVESDAGDEPAPIQLPRLAPRVAEPTPRRLFPNIRILPALGAIAATIVLGLGLFAWRISTRPVATLTASVGCVWEQTEKSPALGESLSSGKTLQLAHGFAELKYPSGAKVVVEAPATIVLSARDRLTLLHGRVVAMVPPPAHGFTISTPSGEIVDLGTEFGVDVTSDSNVETQVFVGKIQVQAKGQASAAPLTLTAGQGAHLADAGITVESIAAGPSRYVREIHQIVAAHGTVADALFSGGGTYSTTKAVDTSGVSDPAPESVYQSERYGNFTCTIPNLAPGNAYTVRLHFAEIYCSKPGERLFNVSINGRQVLNSFDILAAAGGAQKAITEPFGAVAEANGTIVIGFTDGTNHAKVNGIDIVPMATAPAAPVLATNPVNQNIARGQNASFTASASGSPTPAVQWQCSTDGGQTFSNITANASAQSITLTLSSAQRSMHNYRYRALFSNPTGEATSASATLNVDATFLNAGGPAVGDYLADAHFSDGRTFSTPQSIDISGVSDPAPPSVYQTERYGDFTYTIPNLAPRDGYTVRLHFAEINKTRPGERLFNVSINGQQVLSSFDVFAAAGGPFKAITESFPAVADANGAIVITFTSVKDNAKVSAIDIH